MPEAYAETPLPDEVPGLLRALRVLRERWWIVAICAVISFAVALIYLQREPKQYTATAALQFTTNSLPGQLTGVGQSQSLDPEGEKATNVQLVTTAPVAVLVIQALKLKSTPAQLLNEVSASNPQNDYIVDISATDQNAQRAANIANAFAQQYVVYSQQQNEKQLIKGEQLINSKYQQLPPTDTVDRANLRALSQKLLLLQAVQTGNAQIVNTAATPSSPSSPKKKATAIAALVVGVLLGIGLAFLLNMMDRRVKSLEEVEDLYGVSALATIPRLPQGQQTPRKREIAMEPFRILLNSLSLITGTHDTGTHEVKTVLVTSAVSGEGKTTVALGLARAAALSGQRVILVEADMRRPNLEQRLGLGKQTRGLASVLAGDDDPLELLHSIPGLSRLKVLVCGPTPKSATSLLRPEELIRTFEAIGSQADLVVVDSAPLLPVVDTRELLDEIRVDACLVVARAGSTKRDEARRARSVFDRRQLSNIGLVINALPDITRNYYYDDGSQTQAEVVDGDPKLAAR